MIHDAEPGREISSPPRQPSTAFRGRGNQRHALLGVFAAVAVLAIACGGGDGDVSNASSSIDQDTTTNAGVATILTSIGEAPDFEVITPTDGLFNLERLEGRPVLLNFWFPSCPPCRAELPDLQAAYEAHGDDIQFIGVQLLGLDSADEAAEFLSELGVKYPSGPDEESRMVRSFKIVGFPTTVFIDSDHNVVKKNTGILDAERLESLISATIASGGQTVSSGS